MNHRLYQIALTRTTTRLVGMVYGAEYIYKKYIYWKIRIPLEQYLLFKRIEAEGSHYRIRQCINRFYRIRNYKSDKNANEKSRNDQLRNLEILAKFSQKSGIPQHILFDKYGDLKNKTIIVYSKSSYPLSILFSMPCTAIKSILPLKKDVKKDIYSIFLYIKKHIQNCFLSIEHKWRYLKLKKTMTPTNACKILNRLQRMKLYKDNKARLEEKTRR